LDTKSEGVGLMSVQLVPKISNLCDHNPPTSQTDGQTDDMQKTKQNSTKKFHPKGGQAQPPPPKYAPGWPITASVLPFCLAVHWTKLARFRLHWKSLILSGRIFFASCSCRAAQEAFNMWMEFAICNYRQQLHAVKVCITLSAFGWALFTVHV